MAEKDMIKQVIRSALALLYPMRARCLGCGDMTGNEHEDFLCDRCRRKMDRLRGLYEAPLAVDSPLRRAVAPYPYLAPIRGVIQAFKFSSLPTLCEPLSRDLCRLLKERALTGYDCVAPVPLHPRREYQRGYNQSLLLVERVAGELSLPVYTGLVRTRFTRQQAQLSAVERRKNLQRAFACKQPLAARHVLLIDDVFTTGSTAEGCALALRAAGARTVDVCTIAQAGSKTGENGVLPGRQPF